MEHSLLWWSVYIATLLSHFWCAFAVPLATPQELLQEPPRRA